MGARVDIFQYIESNIQTSCANLVKRLRRFDFKLLYFTTEKLESASFTVTLSEKDLQLPEIKEIEVENKKLKLKGTFRKKEIELENNRAPHQQKLNEKNLKMFNDFLFKEGKEKIQIRQRKDNFKKKQGENKKLATVKKAFKKENKEKK